MYLDKAKALLAELGYVKPNHIYPCTEEEVVAYEKFLGVGLPLAYRKFFLWGGHGIGDIHVGLHFYYNWISSGDFREYSRECLRENGADDSIIDDKTIVIFCSQGCAYDYIRIDEGNNPPVYRFYESKEGVRYRQMAETYSDYLADIIRDSQKYAQLLVVERASDLLDPPMPDRFIERIVFYGHLPKSDYDILWRSLLRFVNLISLDLRFWSIEELPSVIGQLTKLQDLNLNSNKLTQLPIELTNLKQLQVLYLGENQLQSVIHVLRQLPNLKTCWLKGNPLMEEEVAQIRAEFPFVQL